MKNYFLSLFVLILTFSSCEENEVKNDSQDANQSSAIAKIQNGKIVFTDQEALISEIENNLRKVNSMDSELVDLKIDYSEAIDNPKVEVIQLIASNFDRTVKISYLVEVDNNQFKLANGESSVVTCTGCREGCNPKRDANGDGYCTKCTGTGDYKVCTKTESI